MILPLTFLLASQLAMAQLPNALRIQESPVPENVNFTVTCADTNTEFCEKVKHGLAYAGTALERMLDLQTPVRVHVQVANFCNRTENNTQVLSLTQSCNDTVTGSPSILVAWSNSTSPEVAYPIALVRQLQAQRNTSLVASQSDILLSVNMAHADIMYFNESIGNQVNKDVAARKIAKDQVDFDVLALRALVNGLGMISSFGPAERNPRVAQLESEFEVEAAAVLPMATSHNGTQLGPITILDGFLTATSDSGQTNSTTALLQPLQSYLDNGQQKPEALRALLFLGNVDALNFVFPTNQNYSFASDPSMQVELQEDVSAVQQFVPVYAKSNEEQEFVMFQQPPKGFMLKPLMQQSGNSLPLGPNTVRLLESLGYTMTGRTEEMLRSGANGVHGLHCFVAFLSVVVFAYVI